jgi:hypothetical protein
MADIESLEDQIKGLEISLEGAAGMAGAFEGELARMRESLVFTGREVNTLSTSIGGGLRRAFDGLVFDGLKLSDALKGVAQTMIDTVYSIALKPVQNALGGLVANGVTSLLGGLLPFENGGAFSQGRVMPFAKGGGGFVAAELPDARRYGPDGRGGTRSDYAIGTGCRWSFGGSSRRRWSRGDRGDEHPNPRCAGVSTQPKSDCSASHAGVGARATKQVRTDHGISRNTLSGKS